MRWRCAISLTVVVLSMMMLNSSMGQRRPYVPATRRYCESDVPLTTLEEFAWRSQTVLVTGSTHVETLLGRNGSARVDAIELRDESNGARASGVVLRLRDTARETTNRTDEDSRAYIDYDEIDRVIKAWDQVARTDDTITKLNNFESHYRTKGDIEIAAFRQTPGGAIAASVSTGSCDRVRILLSLDELVKLRHMVAQAKQRLDDLK